MLTPQKRASKYVRTSQSSLRVTTFRLSKLFLLLSTFILSYPLILLAYLETSK